MSNINKRKVNDLESSSSSSSSSSTTSASSTTREVRVKVEIGGDRMDAEMPLPPPSSSPSSSTSSTPREVRVKVEVGGEDRPIDVDDSSSSQSSPSSAQLAQHAKNVLSEQATKFAIKHFYCSITLDVMIDPVLGSDGNIYERYAITDWIERNHNSPVTREPLTLAGLTGIRLLKNQIEEYFTSDDCNSEMKD